MKGSSVVAGCVLSFPYTVESFPIQLCRFSPGVDAKVVAVVTRICRPVWDRRRGHSQLLPPRAGVHRPAAPPTGTPVKQHKVRLRANFVCGWGERVWDLSVGNKLRVVWAEHKRVGVRVWVKVSTIGAFQTKGQRHFLLTNA